jgi:hypothetical protein
MVSKHLQDLFDLKDLASDFMQFFQVYSHVITSCIPRSIVWAFVLAMFLALVKPSRSIQPIMVGEFLYQLVNVTLCL